MNAKFLYIQGYRKNEKKKQQPKIKMKIMGISEDRNDCSASSFANNRGIPTHSKSVKVSMARSIRVTTTKILRPSRFWVILYHLAMETPIPEGSNKL
jgi:hypothetical protein